MQAGNLKKIGLPKLLNTIGQEKKSGILFIRSQRGIGSIAFENGMITQAESPIMPRRIGRILIETGALTEKQLQQALKTQEEEGRNGPWGRSLIRLGFIDGLKLQEIIRLQLIDSIHSMLDWRDAMFRFDTQEVSAGHDILLSPRDLLVEAARPRRWVWCRRKPPLRLRRLLTFCPPRPGNPSAGQVGKAAGRDPFHDQPGHR